MPYRPLAWNLERKSLVFHVVQQGTLDTLLITCTNTSSPWSCLRVLCGKDQPAVTWDVHSLLLGQGWLVCSQVWCSSSGEGLIFRELRISVLHPCEFAAVIWDWQMMIIFICVTETFWMSWADAIESSLLEGEKLSLLIHLSGLLPHY